MIKVLIKPVKWGFNASHLFIYLFLYIYLFIEM